MPFLPVPHGIFKLLKPTKAKVDGKNRCAKIRFSWDISQVVENNLIKGGIFKKSIPWRYTMHKSFHFKPNSVSAI